MHTDLSHPSSLIPSFPSQQRRYPQNIRRKNEPDPVLQWRLEASRRFINQYLLTRMISSGAKSEALEQAKTRADTLYEEASSITLNGDWKAAVKKVDPAYRVLK